MNELTLCIVNEGEDYQNRLETARLPNPAERFSRWSSRVRLETIRQNALEDSGPFTVADMAQAVIELDDYYQRHIAEF